MHLRNMIKNIGVSGFPVILGCFIIFLFFNYCSFRLIRSSIHARSAGTGHPDLAGSAKPGLSSPNPRQGARDPPGGAPGRIPPYGRPRFFALTNSQLIFARFRAPEFNQALLRGPQGPPGSAGDTKNGVEDPPWKAKFMLLFYSYF